MKFLNIILLAAAFSQDCYAAPARGGAGGVGGSMDHTSLPLSKRPEPDSSDSVSPGASDSNEPEVSDTPADMDSFVRLCKITCCPSSVVNYAGITGTCDGHCDGTEICLEGFNPRPEETAPEIVSTPNENGIADNVTIDGKFTCVHESGTRWGENECPEGQSQIEMLIGTLPGKLFPNAEYFCRDLREYNEAGKMDIHSCAVLRYRFPQGCCGVPS